MKAIVRITQASNWSEAAKKDIDDFYSNFIMIDPVTITTLWSSFKAGYEIVEFINKKFTQDEAYYRVFVFNGTSDTMYVALHFHVKDCWVTRKWFELQAGETALLLGNETKLKNRVIYSYASNADGTREAAGSDFSENIDGEERCFSEYTIPEGNTNFLIKYVK